MAKATLPNRLHHTAYVTKDMEATRKFYEDVLGFPLIATWCEKDILFGKERTYIHCFFGIADGSALAFFQFADPEDQKEFGPEMPPSPFHHIALDTDAATQSAMEDRIAAAGIKEPGRPLGGDRTKDGCDSRRVSTATSSSRRRTSDRRT